MNVLMLPDIKSLTREELEAQFKLWEQPAYRVTQLQEWLYVPRATAWEAMTNLPKTLRAQLAENYSLQSLELVRKQGARSELHVTLDGHISHARPVHRDDAKWSAELPGYQ